MKWIVGLIALCLSINALAFSVTLTHQYGTLTIDKKPLKVVSVGQVDHDDILSFGVKPIAIRDWYGNQPYGVWPWAQSALGNAKPVLLDPRIIDYETIAALKPDLIIGVSAALDEKEYQKLNSIAPTLAGPSDYEKWTIPWDVRHLMIGKALGFEAVAKQHVTSLQQKLQEVKSQHPEFEGKTAAVAFYYNKQPGAYASKDLRSQFLMSLGFIIPEEIDQIAGDAFYASFSEERLDLLNNDIVVWLASEEAVESASTAIFRERMPFYKDHKEYFTGDLVGGAFSFFSYLSIQYLIDEMVPELAKVTASD
ncbi:ABC transporter substrate-binding protein [Psychromonas sp. GE-S-Ul-11]|uniref:ABC transporter substrate-binding protein n=1 Tax=Psychromonas sp. GE-S-Ul-11 TaxID=3241170 RepID=UPI00390C9A16